MSFEDDLRTLVRARHPIIWVVTHEEGRSLRVAANIACDPKGDGSASPKSLYVWSASTGVRKVEQGKPLVPVQDTESPIAAINHIVTDKAPNGAIYVLRDLHRYIDSEVYRSVRDLAAILKPTTKTVIITSPVSKFPIELEKDIVLIDMPLPTTEELGIRLDSVLATFSAQEGTADIGRLENGQREAVIRAALGLTEDEAESAFLESVVRLRRVDPRHVVKSKEQIVRKAGIEFADSSDGMASVGGLENLKTWIGQHGAAFSVKAQKFGLPFLRGVLLTGPPGTGKSLSARAIANHLGFPILRVSASAIFGRYVGESEQNIRRIVKTAEAVAPSVLYIDELEKLTSGMGGGDNDNGVSRKVLGELLQWMSDHTAPVLVVATANNPVDIPAEMTRAGRFDAIFFVDMPDANERLEIFSIHLKKKDRVLGLNAAGASQTDKEMFAHVIEKTEGFSGSEIEHVVNEALFAAYADGERALRISDLLTVASGMRPLSVTRKAQIDAMRKWASENAIPASRRDEAPKAALLAEV